MLCMWKVCAAISSFFFSSQDLHVEFVIRSPRTRLFFFSIHYKIGKAGAARRTDRHRRDLPPSPTNQRWRCQDFGLGSSGRAPAAMHHDHRCPPADHCHAPCSPQPHSPPPPFGEPELWWDSAFHPSPLPRSCSSSSSDGTDVSCTVHVEAPSTAAPLLEPKPGDGAVFAGTRPSRLAAPCRRSAKTDAYSPHS